MKYVIVHVPILSDSILMIRKNRPDWQAGKLNLPGGHIEEDEAPLHLLVADYDRWLGR